MTADLEMWATLNASIGAESLNKLSTFLTYALGQRAVALHLVIQSAGGAVGDGIAMFNYIRHCPIPITTYNVGTVSSIATIAYLGGTKRVVDRLANFMLHMPSNNSAQVLHRGNISILERSLSLDEFRIAAVVRELTTIPDEMWMVHGRDLLIAPEDAVECGLAHQIGSFKPPKGCVVHNVFP